MGAPLVTRIASDPEPTPPDESLLVLFNDRQGPQLVHDIVRQRHAFIEHEVWATHDEEDRPAFLLSIRCETADARTLFDLIGSRLPDYIQARRFPPSRMQTVRRTGERLA